MSPTKKNAIREYYVVKANSLIREGRYNLSTMQQKLILMAISKIKKNDKPDKEYEMTFEEICDTCGMNIDAGGTYYKRLKADLLKLNSPFWAEDEEEEWTVSWLVDVKIGKRTGKVSYRIHKKIRPYVFNLQEKYTQYKLGDVLPYKNKYAIRLYEILRSFYTQQEIDEGKKKEIKITLEHLREQFMITTYPEWKVFNRDVLQKAVAEINKYSEQMNVEYQTITHERKVSVIIFTVSVPDIKSRLERYNNIKNSNGYK